MILPFSHPAVLALLPLPAWLALRVWRRQQSRLTLPFDHGGARRGRLWSVLINAAESLPALLLAVVLLILAGPQQQGAPRTRRVMTNIEFCVDISGSMTAPFGDGTRYDGSMAAMAKFLEYREGDAFGLTFFGNNVLHWVPLTTDVSALKCALPFMRPERVPYWFGGTEIGKALLACSRVLSAREEGDRAIVLVSDGYSFDLGGDRAAEIAQHLKERNIVVYAIHVADTTVPEPIVNLTGWTGGAVFGAGDPRTLEAVFARIDKLQKTRLVQRAPETLDHFFPYCAAGLSLVGLIAASLFGMRYTPW